MGNSCPCQASFDEQHLQAAEKWISRGQVKLYNKQSLRKLLLVEDLEKIAFGLCEGVFSLQHGHHLLDR